jgi:hypothetical protein
MIKLVIALLCFRGIYSQFGLPAAVRMSDRIGHGVSNLGGLGSWQMQIFHLDSGNE